MAKADVLSSSALESADSKTRSRGWAIENKIDMLESMASNVSNRRSRRWLNNRMLIELVPRLNVEEIRGLFAPPPWGDDAPLSAFCMANTNGWDDLRNSDMDSEAKYTRRTKNLSGKNDVNNDKLIALNGWHRLDRQTREVLRRSFLSDLLVSYEDQVRSFIEHSEGDDALILQIDDPFHRLILHGICEFYNLSSVTLVSVGGDEAAPATTSIKKRASTGDALPSITLVGFLKMVKCGIF